MIQLGNRSGSTSPAACTTLFNVDLMSPGPTHSASPFQLYPYRSMHRGLSGTLRQTGPQINGRGAYKFLDAAGRANTCLCLYFCRNHHHRCGVSCCLAVASPPGGPGAHGVPHPGPPPLRCSTSNDVGGRRGRGAGGRLVEQCHRQPLAAGSARLVHWPLRGKERVRRSPTGRSRWARTQPAKSGD